MKTVNPSTSLEGYGERPSTTLGTSPEFIEGRSRTIKFYTLGCKVNQYDTQSIRERFLRNGYQEIYNGGIADIYLINTCSVTANADRKSRNIIRYCIRDNPKAKVIVTGCLVEKDAATLSYIKGITFIISKRFFPEKISNFSGHTRAFLKIQDGCNNLCSYCKVPLVRGISRSKPLDEIIKEAENLVKNGFKEIVLSGICLGSYGKDLKTQLNFVDAISGLENIEGLLRIRLSSIEAGDVSGELINKISQSHLACRQTPKLCRHLHIPIQSGDNEILEKMNRNYYREDYLSLIKKIRSLIPEIAITTDVLVGFPGEREDNFYNTVSLIKEILPSRVHIFPYSPREGTFAFDLEDRVNLATIRQRILQLKAITQDCSFNYRRQFLNKNMDVLVETQSKENPHFWEGYTDNYIKVWVKSKKNLKNQLIPVKLKEIDRDSAVADLY